MVNVKKADGTLQPFDRKKVLRTCERMRLSKKEAEEVVDEIEQKIFEGIPTKKIIDMILEHGKKHRPQFEHMIDLREALGKMKSKPDFEQFVSILLEDQGYKTVTNKILQGRCVEHEIDVIGVKGNETVYVEIKHHDQFHTFTGLDTFFQVNSAFQDLVEGYMAKRHKYNFTKAMLVSNTKISNHAKDYSSCREIDAIAWSTPHDGGIETFVHGKLFYPITILKNLDIDIRGKLGDDGIYTLKQLLEADKRELANSIGVDEKYLQDILDKAKQILSS